MNKVVSAAVVLLALGLLGCGQNPFEATGTVVGSVRDFTTGHPIVGASVTIGGRHTTTDNNGDFELEVPTGDQDVEVYTNGYLGGKVAEVRVTENQTTYMNTVYLTPAHYEGNEQLVYLADLPAVNEPVDSGQGILAGVYYYHALGGRVSRWDESDNPEWNIGQMFQRFRATLGVFDNQPEADGKVVFQIMGDGNLLHQSPQMRVGDQPDVIDLPVDGVLRLKISIISVSGTPETYYIIGDPVLARPK